MLRFTVIAHPGARTERVALVATDTLGVWVRQPPAEGRANAAIERVIADTLGLRRRQVKIVGGTASRRKIVQVDLPDPQALEARLMAYGLRPDGTDGNGNPRPR
jgi:uncharacterized protein YggU (UPF0235/DUF167 family)